MSKLLKLCFWGYSFENLATEDSGSTDADGLHHIDANVEYCSVIKTKLGAHRIIMGAEMDCCDSTDDGRRFYVELKTSRELDYHTEERFERERLLKFWIQSFLADVPFIVVGFRDDAGRLVRTERLRTNDITQRVKMKNYWQLNGTCKRILKELHSYEKEVEKETTRTADMKEKGADPYDLKQQENVLAELRMMVPDCHTHLEASLADLTGLLEELKESNQQGPEIEEAQSIIAEVKALFQSTEG